MTYISDPTQNVILTIPYQGSTYTLKLKVNLRDKNASTAKLISEKEIYQLGKKNIFWQGLDKELPAAIPKKVKKIASSIYIKPTNDASAPFEVYMGANPIAQTSSAIPTKNIVSVQSSEEFVNLFKEQSSLLMDLFKQMIICFCEASSLNSLDVNEIISLSEFLPLEDRAGIIQKIRDSRSDELITAALKAMKTAGSGSRIEEVIELTGLTINQENPGCVQLLQFARCLSSRLRRDLEDHETHSIRQFLNKFCFLSSQNKFCSLSSQTDKQRIADCKIIKSWLYCGDHDSNVFPDNQTLSQTIQQFSLAQNIDSPRLHLLLLRTLLDISLIKDEGPILQENALENLNLREICGLKQSGYYHNAFLFQNSRQLLKFSPAEKTWFKSIDRPWCLLKYIGNDSLSPTEPNFKEVRAHLPTISSKKHLTFFYLYLLQTAYLKESVDTACDFIEFVDDLNDPKKAGRNQALLPVHKRHNFVLGLVELLDSLTSPSAALQIRDKSLCLLKTILNNNQEDDPTASTLFRIKSSAIRRYVTKQIQDILAQSDENKQSATGLSQIFQTTLKTKYPLLACLRNQLEKLKNDTQFIEDRRYMVDLMAVSAKNPKARPLRELVDEQILLEKKLTVLSALRGLGKTFFLKNYLLNLLENYQLGKAFPFYILVEGLENPRDQLMQNSIQELGLGHCEEELQKSNTIWFLDDVQTMFSGGSREYDGYTFYDKNHLKNWNNAQFFLACDPTGFSAEDMARYFTFNGKYPQKLDIIPFDENQVDRFLEKYIQVRLTHGLPVWSIEEYKKGIAHLGLKDVIRTIQFLRLALDFLSEYKKNPLESQNSILDVWLVEALKKASKSSCSSTAHSSHDYLNYLLDVQRLMQICGTHSVQKKENLPLDPAKADLQNLLFGSKSHEFRTDILFKTNPQGAVEYCTPLLYDFLKEIRADSNKKENLLRLLSTE